MNKTLILATLLASTVFFPSAVQARKKKGHADTTQVVKKTEYDKLMETAGRRSATGGFVSLHVIKGKLYVEMPVKTLGRDILLASTPSQSSNSRFSMVGYKQYDPLHIRFEKLDSSIVMHNVSTVMESDPELVKAISQHYAQPMQRKFDIKAWSNDSLAVLFDMTDVFLGDDIEELNPMAMNYSILKIKSTPVKALASLGKIKAFDDNASIESLLTFKASLTFQGAPLSENNMVSVHVVRSMLLLPEEPMKPRISDTRVGAFITTKRKLTMQEDGIKAYSLANRWRLEPSDTAAWLRGELVEPKKPIVWYVDDTFPQEWKEPLKRSVTLWNTAFERLGFKNAMEARDFPQDDPEFDPDNLKYSCIRYVPISVENAQGPSWVDPRSGEIVNASVIVLNDVIKLINNWRFVQTAQIDPRVRAQKMPKDIVDESLTYVFSHEIGHTLGLMHNMSASSTIPVDSLRSASYTREHGTTPSIMDYARFNYVAQPGDEGVRLTPPDIGEYDYYAIDWLYRVFPGGLTPEQEAQRLEAMVDSHVGDDLYRYGRQQIYSRYDPTALEEDLGDDAMKAGEYGIRNLQYILAHLNEWIKDDPSGAHRQELYDAIAAQFSLYLGNALMNVGGIRLTAVKDGTAEVRQLPTPRARQREALRWVIEKVKESSWLSRPDVLQLLPLSLKRDMTVYNVVGKSLLSLDNRILLSSHLSSDPYTQQEYYDDLFTLIFEKSGAQLTTGEKMMQRTAVQQMSSTVTKAMPSSSRGLTTLEDIALYRLDPTGYITQHYDELSRMEDDGVDVAREFLSTMRGFGDTSDFGFQEEVSTSLIDEQVSLRSDLLRRIARLCRQRLGGKDRAHYQQLLMMIEKATGTPR